MALGCGRRRIILTLLFLLICFFLNPLPANAQDSLADIEKEASGRSTDLGRRGKITLNSLVSDAVRDSKDGNYAGLALAFDSTGLGVFDAFFASLSMILVSEVLSTGLGRIVPNLISRKHTNSAATVLYAFFGVRLLYIAWRSNSHSSQKKEMEEVEEKLEAGAGKTNLRRLFSRFCTPIFLESFILTFLAEWGDRSQIATIALATHKNAVGVAVGATIGHTICTSLAVIGGSMLASKISQRTVATVGGFLFLGFSISSYFYPPL